ncbi:MAG TPA: hypothetical protein VHC49_23005 [Mycobacteriales bacterium]|nr:hypothetical protein [Mycobacteriales bacterium]
MSTLIHRRRHSATVTASTVEPSVATEQTRSAAIQWTLVVLRLALAWEFLWAFLDKTFGLGHETASGDAWIHGGSPTKGFLAFGASGPFKGFYHSIAGDGWADWLFMLALAGLAVALFLGIGMRVAVVAGVVLTVMMWSVVLPPENNVFMDYHLVYALALIAIGLAGTERTFGLGRWWQSTALVQRWPWLK